MIKDLLVRSWYRYMFLAIWDDSFVCNSRVRNEIVVGRSEFSVWAFVILCLYFFSFFI